MHARFFFYLFTASLLQPGAAAFAEEGHFSIPEKAVPLTSQPVQGIKTSDSLRSSPPAGCDRPMLEAWFKAWRQKARHDFAEQVARNIPILGLASPVQGASCIRSPEAFDARYEKNGDFFVLTCLAQSKGKLTHLFKLELKVDPAACLSDAKIQEWVRSTKCNMPGGTQLFLEQELIPCPKGALPPQFRGPAVAYEIDPDFFSRLLNDRPSIQRIVDEDRRVKVGARPSGGRTDPGCGNPLGCDPPGLSNSRDVK